MTEKFHHGLSTIRKLFLPPSIVNVENNSINNMDILYHKSFDVVGVGKKISITPS